MQTIENYLKIFHNFLGQDIEPGKNFNSIEYLFKDENKNMFDSCIQTKMQ